MDIKQLLLLESLSSSVSIKAEWTPPEDALSHPSHGELIAVQLPCGHHRPDLWVEEGVISARRMPPCHRGTVTYWHLQAAGSANFDRALFAPCDKHPITVVLQRGSEQDLPFVIPTRSNCCQHTATSHGRFRSGFLTPERGLMRLPVAPINLIPPKQCVAAVAEVLCSPWLICTRCDSAAGLTEGTGMGRNSPGFQATSLTLLSSQGFPLHAAWCRSLFSTSGSFQTN